MQQVDAPLAQSAVFCSLVNGITDRCTVWFQGAAHLGGPVGGNEIQDISLMAKLFGSDWSRHRIAPRLGCDRPSCDIGDDTLPIWDLGMVSQQCDDRIYDLGLPAS